MSAETTTEEAFRREMAAEGIEVREVTWEAGTVNERHSHEFHAHVLCTRGEILIETDDGETRCGPGHRMDMAAGRMHAERVGPEGVTLLAGRRTG